MNKLTNFCIQHKIFSTLGGNVTVDELFYIYSDHLSTPRKITNQDNILHWFWHNIDPFGDNEPVSNSNIEFNFRFPEQYYDKETKTNYNLFRDYNSSLGRYMQSDPMGLNGGLNSYAYANQNYLTFFDLWGLDTTLIFIRDYLGLNHVALIINNKIYDINPGNNKKENASTFDSIFYFNRDAKNSDNANTGDFFTNYFLKDKYHSIYLDLYHLNLYPIEEKNLIKTFNSMSGNYNLFFNNCATFINNILYKNKIKRATDINKLMTPYLLQISLENDFIFQSKLIKKETKRSVLNYNQYTNKYLHPIK